jgi:hypothetical protein
MKATTGMAACWARTAPGHAAAAPPRSVMNSRRRTLQHGLPCGTRCTSYLMVRLLEMHPQCPWTGAEFF